MKMTGFGRPLKRTYDRGGGCSNCGNNVDRAGRYCKACHALYMRNTRPKHSEMTQEQRKKSVCRSYANVYQRRGKLIKQPCERCGSADSQKHHEDYSKPLDVRWLCRECHLLIHQAIETSTIVGKSAEQ